MHRFASQHILCARPLKNKGETIVDVVRGGFGKLSHNDGYYTINLTGETEPRRNPNIGSGDGSDAVANANGMVGAGRCSPRRYATAARCTIAADGRHGLQPVTVERPIGGAPSNRAGSELRTPSNAASIPAPSEYAHYFTSIWTAARSCHVLRPFYPCAAGAVVSAHFLFNHFASRVRRVAPRRSVGIRDCTCRSSSRADGRRGASAYLF